MGTVAVASTLVGLATAAAFAGEMPTDSAPTDRVVSLGLFSFYGPKYLGAERYGPFAFPTLDVRRPDEGFALASPDDGLSVALLETSHFRLGPVATLRQGRNAGIDPRFAGLDHAPWTIEAGMFADWWVLPERLRTRVELRHGLRGGDGFAIDLSADLFSRIGRFTLAIGPRLGIVDAGLARIQFGVSEAAAMRNPLFSAFNAQGGLQTVGLAASIDYNWSSAWRSTLYGRFDRLVGDAAASSITRRLGSEEQFTAGLGLTYSFGARLPLPSGLLPR
ncbi:MipA/OmpV family protein [Methylobacterium brachiatum]